MPSPDLDKRLVELEAENRRLAAQAAEATARAELAEKAARDSFAYLKLLHGTTARVQI